MDENIKRDEINKEDVVDRLADKLLARKLVDKMQVIQDYPEMLQNYINEHPGMTIEELTASYEEDCKAHEMNKDANKGAETPEGPAEDTERD